MKILHVIDSAGIYGAEVMLLNLMREQKKQGEQPILLGIESESVENPPDIVKEATRDGIQVVRMSMKRGYNKEDAFRIIACAESNKIDLIHSHGYKSDILLGFMSRQNRKIPTISTVHGWISVRMLTKIWLYNFFDKIALRRLDAIVYVNPTASNVVRHRNPFYVENGIPECDFSLEEGIDSFFNHTDQKQIIIGSISRLSEEKGLIFLLKAAKELLDFGLNIKLAVIGEGKLRDEYEKFISQHNLEDKVRILGYKPNAYKYLRLFDIFVIPSLTEGLPITLLEAMQSEIPIVATKVGAIPHVLENGKYGKLVNPANIDELSNAISLIIKSPEESLKVAKQARIHANKSFSCAQMAIKYSEIYRKVVKQ